MRWGTYKGPYQGSYQGTHQGTYKGTNNSLWRVYNLFLAVGQRRYYCFLRLDLEELKAWNRPCLPARVLPKNQNSSSVLCVLRWILMDEMSTRYDGDSVCLCKETVKNRNNAENVNVKWLLRVVQLLCIGTHFCVMFQPVHESIIARCLCCVFFCRC